MLPRWLAVSLPFSPQEVVTTDLQKVQPWQPIAKSEHCASPAPWEGLTLEVGGLVVIYRFVLCEGEGAHINRRQCRHDSIVYTVCVCVSACLFHGTGCSTNQVRRGKTLLSGCFRKRPYSHKCEIQFCRPPDHSHLYTATVCSTFFFISHIHHCHSHCAGKPARSGFELRLRRRGTVARRRVEQGIKPLTV